MPLITYNSSQVSGQKKILYGICLFHKAKFMENVNRESQIAFICHYLLLLPSTEGQFIRLLICLRWRDPIVHLYIWQLNKHFSGTYYLPHAVLGAGHKEVSKFNKGFKITYLDIRQHRADFSKACSLKH